MILTLSSHSGPLNLSSDAFSHPGLLFSSGENESIKDAMLRLIKRGRFVSQPDLDTDKRDDSSRHIDFTQSDRPNTAGGGEEQCVVMLKGEKAAVTLDYSLAVGAFK